ncbi:MAG TPA: ABC transporter ATP-binding protein [Nitrososphaerales archaeon]|nr:ABC transporter ATP-binding protein [Nitrososphaerales archaeon]
MLHVEGVSKVYGKKAALDKVNLDVPVGVHMLLLGPNGAGKTTLIKCVMNLIRYKGKIEVDGIDTKKKSKAARSKIGYVPQSYALYDNISVMEHAKLTAKLKGVGTSEIDQILTTVGMFESKKKKVRELSSGMRQRVGIALALIGNPPFLILDEPTSNVDMRGRFEFQKILDELIHQGKTMLSTTHFAGLGEMATNVVIVDQGKVVATGDPNVLLAKLKASTTIYLKLGAPDTPRALDVLRTAGATEIREEQNWTAVTLPPDRRMDAVSSLIKQGCAIEDMIFDRVAIESEYLKFLEGGSSQ